jgi:hypothetical protein
MMTVRHYKDSRIDTIKRIRYTLHRAKKLERFENDANAVEVT